MVSVVGTPGKIALAFTSAGAVAAYLPAVGTPGPLTASPLNPTTTSAGVFGGDLVALELNIGFNNAGFSYCVTFVRSERSRGGTP
jgi:hypothetical protein